MASEAPGPSKGEQAQAEMVAETNGKRLISGELKPEKFILDGTLKLLAALDAERDIAKGRHLLDVGKLWMTTANGVMRARRRLREK